MIKIERTCQTADAQDPTNTWQVIVSIRYTVFGLLLVDLLLGSAIVSTTSLEDSVLPPIMFSQP